MIGENFTAREQVSFRMTGGNKGCPIAEIGKGCGKKLGIGKKKQVFLALPPFWHIFELLRGADKGKNRNTQQIGSESQQLGQDAISENKTSVRLFFLQNSQDLRKLGISPAFSSIEVS